MRLYKFLFYKTHSLLYPIMADVNKMMSQWIVSGLVSLAIFFNLIEGMAFLEIKFDLGIGFSSKVMFVLTLVAILLLNYRIYVHQDNYKQINSAFRETELIKILTGILIVGYYAVSVRLLFYVLEHSPWRGEM